jgi:serine/threonine protein phosphatase 1
MRLLAIGDIHGCLRALETLLAAVSPQPDDQIITLGDYVDRGPDSRGVLERLVALYDRGRLVPLIGNHDLMLLQARDIPDSLWLGFGGDATLRSYGIAEPMIEQALGNEWNGEALLGGIPERHWQFLERDCVPYFETQTHFFVHANAYPDVPLSEQPDFMLYWEKLIEPCAHVSGKIMVCGHTRQKNGVPLDLGTTICIDTNIYEGGWLTCLDVLARYVWQANENGELRQGTLDDAAKWAE